MQQKWGTVISKSSWRYEGCEMHGKGKRFGERDLPGKDDQPTDQSSLPLEIR